VRLSRRAFDDLPGWSADDVTGVVHGLRRCRDHLAGGAKPYRIGSLGLLSEDFGAAFAALDGFTGAAARHFIEAHFVPFAIAPIEHREDRYAGFVTGYYEPEIAVRAEPDTAFRFPFYRRPADLVSVDASVDHPNLPSAVRFARRTQAGLREYPDRKAIECGYLAGQGLEIAYAASRVDVFFAHVQGAARLVYDDGTVCRITFDGKSGHPFTGIGGLLAERGDIARADVTMATIRDWLDRHPDRQDEILWANRSFIFFKDAPSAQCDGPIAAAKVPLIDGRSLAVDRDIHTFGSLFYIDAPTLASPEGAPFQRTMIAHDTGSAILGVARGDIFAGSGDAAGDWAGSVKHPADFYILVPKAAAERFG
jgi:membrane-bound lytic murein transglycosylase A